VSRYCDVRYLLVEQYSQAAKVYRENVAALIVARADREHITKLTELESQVHISRVIYEASRVALCEHQEEHGCGLAIWNWDAFRSQDKE